MMKQYRGNYNFPREAIWPREGESEKIKIELREKGLR